MMKFFSNIVNFFSPFDFKGNEQFNKIAELDGLQKASQFSLTNLNLQVVQQGTINSTNPQLIISNHIGGLDIAIIKSLLSKNNYVISLYASKKTLPKSFADDILPVYFSGKPQKFNNIIDQIFYSYCVSLEGNLSREEAMQKNRQTIATAAELISQGASVIIFPTGEMNEGGHWKPGVGHLLKQIRNPNAEIILTQIKGITRVDEYRIFKPSLRRLFFKPKTVEVTFHTPLNISELALENQDIPQIINRLEQEYCKIYPSENS
ncbi:lysophospholipid acyltransferase family protein [Chroococcus sp. FPU101]|uniref:lysophospholipid acyltransferase family protein n=1 Tax=Chroococcus sp. FPU101 TaxID=1974212 RepID=UPI001A8D5B70|nr:lysophospholipid acyltransferase family protein [Chroococcus sp. FPU101]GFE69555.1 hypothetical protein CFPU101_21650 [Chroococcus sp. FPU101]